MMKLKNSFAFILIFLLIGCGGGSAAFSLNLPLNNTINIDEDNIYVSNINSTTNYKSIITYEISSPSTNGESTITSEGELTYQPSQDFFGDDSVTLNVIATRVDDNNVPTGGVINKSLQLSITINPVNDPPEISFVDDLNIYNNLNLLFDDTLSINVLISDVDNDLSELSFRGDLPNESVDAQFDIIQTFENGITVENQQITFDLSNISNAGLFKMTLCASDLVDTTCNGEIESYYISNKEIKSVNFNCDSEGNNCETSDQYLYYLIGSSDSNAKTDYIFIADQILGSEDESSTADFRLRLIESVNRLKDSDAGQLFQDYFNVLVIEEVAATGFSLFDIETGCYSFDPRVYCIGNVDRDLITSIYENWDVASFLTSMDGRGVAQGMINIQPISYRTAEVVQHELGHSHAFLGDEYDSRGERTFPIYYADFSINTTSTTDATKVKWSHLIDDLSLIPGFTDGVNKYCYNYEDGDVYTRDGSQINYEDCDCYMRQFPESDYSGINTDPSCPNKIGHFEGTYYGEVGTYRSRWLSVMWCCDDKYGEVNVEGFAIGSYLNQGFTDHSISSNGIQDINLYDQNSINNNITFNINATFDEDNLALKWYVDGEEQAELINELVVTFQRPDDNLMKTYSWKVVDLTGILLAPNNTLDPLDLYEGYFEENYYIDFDNNTSPYSSQMPYISSWKWHKIDGSHEYDDTVDLNNPDKYLYAELCCSLGGAYKINWKNYQQETTSASKKSNKIIRTSIVNNVEKIINIDMTINDIKLNRVEEAIAKDYQIKKPKISKNDRYTISFYDQNMDNIYTIGIGDPFATRVQHIGYEDSEIFSVDIPIKNYSIAIPIELEPFYMSINKRGEYSKYNIIKVINLK